MAARTGETGVRRRTQAMSRSASKRRSRFSSLWGLDTTSKKKQGRPSINQVASREDERASTDRFPGQLTVGMCEHVCVPLLILGVISNQRVDTKKLVVLDAFNRSCKLPTLSSAISLTPCSSLPPACFPNPG